MMRGRTRREPEATRDRLLDAAAQVFLETGYDGARVVDIARKAGVTTGAIYAHFRDKADLLVKALAARGVEPATRLLLTDTERPVAGILRTLARIAIEGELHPTEALLLDAAAAARREGELREQLECGIGQRSAVLAAMVERARKERVVAAEIPTEVLVRFLLILGFGSIVTRGLGLAPPDATEWTHLIGRLLEGVAPRPATASRQRPRGPTSAARRRRA